LDQLLRRRWDYKSSLGFVGLSMGGCPTFERAIPIRCPKHALVEPIVAIERGMYEEDQAEILKLPVWRLLRENLWCATSVAATAAINAAGVSATMALGTPTSLRGKPGNDGRARKSCP